MGLKITEKVLEIGDIAGKVEVGCLVTGSVITETVYGKRVH
jgi:hypothetical protein